MLNILKDKSLMIKVGAGALAAVILITLLVLVLLQGHKLNQLQVQLENRAKQQDSEMAETRDKLDFLEQNLYFFGKTGNDLRRALNLPAISYSFFETRQEETPDIDAFPENKRETVLYEGLDVLVGEQKKSLSVARLNEDIKDEVFTSFIEKQEYTFERSGPLSLKLSKEGLVHCTIVLDPQEETYKGSVTNTGEFFSKELDTPFLEKISAADKKFQDYLDQLSSLSNQMFTVIDGENVGPVLDKKWIRRSIAKELDRRVTLTIYKKANGEKVLTTGLNTESLKWYLQIQDQDPELFSDLSEYENKLAEAVKQIDDRRDYQIEVSRARSDIKTLYKDPAFLAVLEGKGLHPAEEFRKDEDFYYYDLLDKDNKRVGSFAVQIGKGAILVMDSDDVPVKNLSVTGRRNISLSDTTYKTDEDIQEITDLLSSKDAVNVLLVGRHGQMTDTIMVVHADKVRGKATIFSIPRDLYYKNRKINSFYQNYGMERLVTEISNITGLKIDHYILVDMYAFIEIIDILGGVEVTLKRDLVDPYYKVKNENGEWATLHYTKGTHLLSGREALRVARSRYTSDDYSRSRRQQLIVTGLKERLLGLSVSDMNTALEMIKATLGYLDTDMNAAMILKLLNDYKDVTINSQNTIDGSNVLYDSYTNLYKLSEEERAAAMEDEDFSKGQWISLPRNNDWNLIKYYVRKLISQ